MEYEKKLEEIRSVLGKELCLRGLELGAIRLNTKKPFLWASGYRMPIYNDNRTFLRDPQSRKKIAAAFEAILNILNISPQWIAGTATAGIPHAATLADAMALPMCYVRSGSKDHGLQKAVEGLGREGSFQQDQVVLIEDLISTGGSSIRAVEALRDAGAQVPCCLAIFSYGLDKAEDAFSQLDPPCRVIPIILYGDLIALAVELGYIEPQEEHALRAWRADPFGWGEAHGFPKES